MNHNPRRSSEFNEGFNAYREHGSILENPYSFVDDFRIWQNHEWASGWEDARKRNEEDYSD